MTPDYYDVAAWAEQGARLHLTDPYTDEPIGAGAAAAIIELRGADSATYQRVVNAKVNRRMAMRGRPAKVTAEEIEAATCDTLAQVTKGWANLPPAVAGDLPFSVENAKRLYLKHRWIRDQVERFVADRANFTPASPAQSSSPAAAGT